VGNYTITLTVTDNYLGRASITKNITIRRGDHISPETTTTVQGIMGKDSWYVSDVTIILNTTDDISGVKYINYKIDNNSWIKINKSKLTLNITEEGYHSITYYSIDQAGNKEENKTIKLKIDKKPPVTIALRMIKKLDTKTSTPYPYPWPPLPQFIILYAKDSASGIAVTKYKINYGTWQKYNEPIEITKFGRYTLYYYSIDKAGNKEKIKQTTIVIRPPKDPYPYYIDME